MPAALNAPSASAGLDNLDQTMAFSNTMTLSPTDGERDAGAVCARRPERAAHRSDRAGGQHRRHRLVRHALGESDRAREHDVSGRRQSLASGWRACASRGHRLSVQRRHDHVSTVDPRRYTFSSLANFLAGIYNNAGFTQTFGVDRGLADQSQRRRLCAGRVEGRLPPDGERRASLRSAVPRNASHRYEQRVAARSASRGRRLDSRRTVVRGSAGLFYDRVPLRALANALLSAGNTTDLNNLRQINVSLSPAQADAPVFPDILSAPVPLVTLVNFTTMDRHIQNAYSRQASLEVEQQFGENSTFSVGLSVPRAAST